MENIISGLKISEWKQDSLCKAYDEIQSRASSIVMFGLQWKDVDTQLASARKLVETELEQLMKREKDVISREKELEAKGFQLNSSIALKETQLAEIQRLIEEGSKEIELNKQQGDSLKLLIEKNREELDVKQRQCAAIQTSIAKKEREFDQVQRRIKEGEKKFDSASNCIEGEKKKLEAVGFLASKETQLAGIEQLIEEQSKVIESHLQHVDSLKSLIEENRDELDVKEKQYAAIQISIADKEMELDHLQGCIEDGEETFASISNRIKKGEEQLGGLEKKIKEKSEEVESKQKEIDLIRKSLRGYREDIELKDRKYNGIRRSIEEHKKEIATREEQLKTCLSSIDDCDKMIKVKEEKLNSIQNSIVECSTELELKEKRLGLLTNDVELKEKNIARLKRILDESAEKYVMKERDFKAFLEKLELRERFCKSKFEEVSVFENKVNACLKEVELKEKKLGSIQKFVDEYFQELRKKEMELEKRVVEFELREKEYDSSKKLTELRAQENNNIFSSQVKTEPSENTHINNAIAPLTANDQFSIPKAGEDLQLLLNRHLKRHDVLCNEISTALQASLNPAKLVLDALNGFYPSNSSREGTETFDVRIVRRSCILLLEQFMEASPQIDSRVGEEALKLARDWKAKMAVANENFLEVLGFLQLLASYRLAFAFDPNEIRFLFNIVGKHRQASELSQFLCPPDNAPVKFERAEVSLANNVTSNLQLMEQENSLAKVVTSNLQLIKQAETSSSNLVTSNLQLSSLQNNILTLLQTSPDPAKIVFDFIQGSISEHWNRGEVGFEASVMRNYILVFDQLFKIFPKIQPPVHKDSIRLSLEWQAKMRMTNTEYSLEVLCFLQFLTTYELISSFNETEILKFLETISQHQQALEICSTIGFAKKIPAFIRKYIERRKATDAVRLICAFKLTDKFPPVPLLTKYVENLKNSTQKFCKAKRPIEEKEKTTNEEIAALRTVIQCITDYNLESKFPSANILKRINLLDRIKKDRRRSATLGKPQQRQKPSSHHPKTEQKNEKPLDHSKAEQQQKPSDRSKAEQKQQKPLDLSKAEQQQQKPSDCPKAEQQHQKSLDFPKADQQQQKPYVCSKDEQQSQKPSVYPKVEQQQQPPVHPNTERQHEQTWKKRRNDNHHNPPQDKHKFPRTSASTVRSHVGPPLYYHGTPPPPVLFPPPDLHGSNAFGFAGDPRQFGWSS
ncbi:FRIGIDA-like protein 5 [Humulus lupulus]|uniref:FRIGIDA-like protein 5 n=1 Tax=Humulus lupulus TaxID=3486 RepID=UPI002B40213C|nr:FRIGIDA-like protein 5 [Humulus lupulus]